MCELKANELRIGNCVYFKHCDYEKTMPRIVNYTKKPNLLALERIPVNIIEYNNIEPIPLTEERLINLGFEYYKVLSHYRIVLEDVWYQVKINEEGKFLFSFTNLNYDEANHMPPKFIKYVHQLQNLYFALAGNELPTANL